MLTAAWRACGAEDAVTEIREKTKTTTDSTNRSNTTGEIDSIVKPRSCITAISTKLIGTNTDTMRTIVRTTEGVPPASRGTACPARNKTSKARKVRLEWNRHASNIPPTKAE